MTIHYLEDFAVGQVFNTGRLRVDKEQIFAFARQFDPQPFHLDEDAARKSPFQGLAASGWHTAALTMRLDGRWRVQAGRRHSRRRLRRAELAAGGSSRRRIARARAKSSTCGRRNRVPTAGLIRVRTTTLNQNDETVMMFTGNLLVPKRPAPAQNG